MSLLNNGNAKTRKGEKRGWKTFGIHLAPNKLSGHNVCKKASPGCAAACLNTAGRGNMTMVQERRIAKTQFFFRDKLGFLTQLVEEITTAVRRATKNSFIPCVRLNLTSDLPWEKIKINKKSVLDLFPDVQFYDYTADADRMTAFLAGEMPANYHLTFSRKENTPDSLVRSFLKSGGNVAIVFRKRVPKRFFGVEVVNGDETDLRFQDGKGKVIGLKEKGRAKRDTSGFVLEPTEGGAA